MAMPMHGFLRSLLAAMLILATPALRAQEESAAAEAEAFRKRLVAAVASGSRRTVASLFTFPMRVTTTLPYPVPIENTAEFVRMYELLFTAEMRCAIEGSRLPQPGRASPAWTMQAADGVVTLANGRIVATRTPAGLRISSLNVLGAPGAAGGRTTRVGFRWGLGEMQYAGRLSLDNRDRYVITARQGDLLQARIERFPGRSLQLQVVERQTKQTIRGAANEYARLWAARLPRDGEYDVAVVRRAAYCDPAIEYLVTLALRR